MKNNKKGAVLSATKSAFGGLNKHYYFRNLFFASLFLILFIYLFMMHVSGEPWYIYILFVINTLLYPYSRYVFEKVSIFIIGKNIFLLELKFALAIKIVTMWICWVFAIFISPIGLITLYFKNKKNETKVKS